MPTDPETKAASESRGTGQRWLARCLSLPSLSVRFRHTSEEELRERNMTPADSQEKKRKRDSEGPTTSNKLHLNMSSKNGPRNAVDSQDSKVIFDNALSSKEDHQDYLKQRRELLQEEDERAWDGAARRVSSPAEKKADRILLAFREYERNVTFGNIASEAIPGKETLDMGGQFLTNKTRIENQSILYNIAKLVPKGALLHLHFNAELHPERLLEEAREMKATMFIRSIRPLRNQEDLELTEMVFNVMPEDTLSVDIFAEDYKGTATNFKGPTACKEIWMRWQEFRDKFNDSEFAETHRQVRADLFMENGRKPNSSEQGHVKLDPAENWLKQKMVLSEEEAYDPAQTVNGVWARFNQATRCFKGLLNYEKVYRWYISKAIDRMIDEKVMYAELRPMLLDKFIPTTNGKGTIDNPSQMQIIVDEVRKKQESLKDKNDFPFGLKIIYCTPRSIPKPMMVREMKDCIALKEQYPDLICGFDLVGAEDRPNHIGFYHEELKAFEQTCQKKGLDIPFLFHAGETLLDTGGSTDPKNSNLYDAVLLKSKRIGHGFALMKHPKLVEKFKYKSPEDPGICIELCPISNELLHLCRNIKEHPFPELLAAGIPCTVNSDNPSLFSNSMSHEFYQIMVGAPTMSIFSWKQLALWSLEYSCLSDSEKVQGKTILMDRWEKFCKYVVKEYGSILAGDEIDKVKLAEFYSRR